MFVMWLEWFINKTVYRILNNAAIADLTKKAVRFTKDGDRRPYLSSDPNQFRVDTTRPLVEHLRQVSRKSDQWSRKRCDNEIVTVLNRAISDLKMTTVRLYLLTNQNHFQADTSRHWEEFICKVSTKLIQWFWGNVITVKIKDGCRRPYLSMDRNLFRHAQLDHQANILGKF